MAARTREEVHYLAGRAAMALELGHIEAAEREVERLREIEKRYDETETG